MWDNQYQNTDPGQDPALVLTRSLPARRQISIRWLTGTVLTGATSCILMGIALFTALDGQQRLVTPPQWFTQTPPSETQGLDTNGYKRARISPTRARQNFDNKKHFELSIFQKKDGAKILQTQGFEWIRMALAEERSNHYTYPAFDALSIFSDVSNNKITQLQDTGHIYGLKVPTTMTLRSYDLIVDQAILDDADIFTDDEAQQETQKVGLALRKINRNPPASSPADSTKFGDLSSDSKSTEVPEVRITQENVTISPQSHRIDLAKNYVEDIIPIHKKQKISEALKKANYTQEQIEQVAEALATFNHSDVLKEKNLLRIGIVTQHGEEDHLVRASIYQGMQHILTIALDDHNKFVESAEPEMSRALKTTFQNGIPLSYVDATQLPTTYDAIYRAILSHNLSQSLARRLIRLLATNIDMKSRITPADRLEIFYAVPKEKAEKKNNEKSSKAENLTADIDPEVYYISATIGNVTHKYYLYRSADGSVDYYDSEGKSSRPFLLRKPVPNAVFGSPFGPRKHPILSYVRMHTGVDWVAPKGSPIIAVGDGVVTRVGIAGGYGNHTEIQHANGYVSSYSHQSSYAPEIKPGVKVQQGQIIGYVGSSGLATGPHCHFEIIVNGTKVNPMRIRLPDSKTLTNQDLQAFMQERDNIDSVINSPLTQPESSS